MPIVQCPIHSFPISQSHLPCFISTHWAEEQAPPLDQAMGGWSARRPHRAELNFDLHVANQIQKPHLSLAGFGLGMSPASVMLLHLVPRALSGTSWCGPRTNLAGVPNPVPTPSILCHWPSSTPPSRVCLPSCICQIREPGQPELCCPFPFCCCARDQGLTQLLGLMLSPPQPRSQSPPVFRILPCSPARRLKNLIVVMSRAPGHWRAANQLSSPPALPRTRPAHRVHMYSAPGRPSSCFMLVSRGG